MKIYHLTIYSKNKKSIKKSLKLLIKKKKILKINIIRKFFFQKPKTKKISLLKSPHVHKKSQEQFEIKIFKIKLIIETTQYFKLLTFFKKIKNILFSDIKLKLKLLISKEIDHKIQTHKNYKYDHIKKNYNTKVIKVMKTLQLLDYQGESLLNCLDSSVGRAKD